MGWPCAGAAALASRTEALLLVLGVLLAACGHAHGQTNIGGWPRPPWPVPAPPKAVGKRAAAAAQLGGACGNTVPPGYAFVPNSQTWGHDISYVGVSGTSQYVWQLLVDFCDKEPRCASISTTGWMKHSYPQRWPTAPIGGMNAWGWPPRDVDILCLGTLVKLGLSCSQVSVCRPRQQGCRGNSTNAPWQYRCTCQPGYRLSADGYLCTSPPFGDNVEFIDDLDYRPNYLVADPKYRDKHVWVFKGFRLAIIMTIDVLDMLEPAMTEFAALGIDDTLPAMSLIVRNLQRVLITFDRLVGMAPPTPVETYDLTNTSLDHRTAYEVSIEETTDVYYLARWSAAGFMTSAPPLLNMFREALKNKSVVDRATLTSMPVNYAFNHIFSTLEYAASNGYWAGHAYVVLDAAMTLTVSTQLPYLRLMHPSNYTFSQLLTKWESSALQALNDTQYSWDSTWFQGTSLADENHPVRVLAAGVFVHLYRRYGEGQYAYLQRFFHVLYELAERIPVYLSDAERFRDNYFIAASVAAPSKDLLPFFTQSLKWKISPTAISYLKTNHGLPHR